jgi:hypothetical protein
MRVRRSGIDKDLAVGSTRHRALRTVRSGMHRPLSPVDRQRASHVVAFLVWSAFVAMVVLWGRWLKADEDIGVGAPPFHGTYDWLLNADLALPVGVALGLVVIGPPAFRRMPSGLVAVSAGLVSVGWALALQRADDKSLTAPLTARYDYLAGVSDVTTPGEYVRTFTERLPDYPIHVRGHPPGTVLIGWALDELGHPGPTPFVVLILTVWGLGIAAVLMALGAVAGADAARRAALPVAVAPAAVWVATSADAMFGGVSAVGLALVVVALSREPSLRADGLALVGGAIFGGAMLLSYGAVLLAFVPLAVAFQRQRVRPLIAASLGGAAVLGGVAAAGFWWFDGLAAARTEYDQGLSSDRPFGYFVVANLAVFAVACGPAMAAGVSGVQPRVRHSASWVLALGALVSLLIADLSGLSKAETERIWLPFVPWVLTVVATTGERTVHMRLLMAGQLACAIVVQVVLRSAW